MSKYFSEKFLNLVPYVPGEQPKDAKYIKLNTNESPFSPSEGVIKAATQSAKGLQLYSDPESAKLVQEISKVYSVNCDQVIMTNGSDEVLNFAFMAFADSAHPLAFANITYGFYPVFAELNQIPYEEIPLNNEFELDYKKYLGINKTIVIANPNAPTGIALSLDRIEEIVKSNPNNVVIIDEAYVDFGAKSAVCLINKYDNLLVTQTFSKSRSMAGARLGFGIGNANLIKDLNTIKYSTNPYNVNLLTSACGVAALEDNQYYMDNCKLIADTREKTASALKELNFNVLDSKANFLFVESNEISGEELYLQLKKNGILVRHFSKPLIKNFNRVTIGTADQMDKFILCIKSVLKEKANEKS